LRNEKQNLKSTNNKLLANKNFAKLDEDDQFEEKLGLDAEDKQDSPLETFEESSFDSDDSMRETLDLNKDQ